jgi:hypothetical protein
LSGGEVNGVYNQVLPRKTDQTAGLHPVDNLHGQAKVESPAQVFCVGIHDDLSSDLSLFPSQQLASAGYPLIFENGNPKQSMASGCV